MHREGQTLEEYLGGQPQREERLLYCIDILKDVCNALIFAHRKFFIEISNQKI